MGIRRDDFREVRPTEEEKAEWRRKHPRQRPPYRAVHKPCGKRMWYSGLAIGSHLRACPWYRDYERIWQFRAECQEVRNSALAMLCTKAMTGAEIPGIKGDQASAYRRVLAIMAGQPDPGAGES